MRIAISLVLLLAAGVAVRAADANADAPGEPAMLVVEKPFTRVLFGHSGTHDPAKEYGPEIIALLDQVWGPAKRAGLKTTGINHVVYGPGDALFAGVEAADTDAAAALGLERHELTLPRYATFKHVGSYAGLPAAWKRVEAEIVKRGLTRGVGGIEIYGHWTEDESKLETDILVPVAPAEQKK